jgi:hypothetical protein
MKRIFTISAALIFAVNVCLPDQQAIAQVPQKMSYQAVIRNSSDQLVADHAVRMKISILQGSATGTAVYVETQSKSTNANGLVTVEIGGGTIVSGTFTGIDWPAGPYFIKTETDPTGGTSYTITGTSQLLSVPYALYSKSSADGFATVYSEADKRPVLIENGNIGIGTSPQNWAKLDINGRMNVGPGQDTWGSQVNINALSLEKGKAYALTSTGGNAGEGQGKLLFACCGKGNIMVMDSSLKVGIGTNNPNSKLDVMGEINVNNNKIINVATPVNATDAATKTYVDGAITNNNTNIVTITGNQSIAGLKYFTNQLHANNTIRITNTATNKSLFIQQTNLYSFISNKANFDGQGSANNGILFLNGQEEVRITCGTANVIGTAVMNIKPEGISVLGEINANNNLIRNVHTPTLGSDAANKAYVEGYVDNILSQVTIHTIGESYGGGIVFYVTPNGQHGLIAETIDQSQDINWYLAQNLISTSAYHSTIGKNYTDWRLPTKNELNLLYNQKAIVGGFSSTISYWSSTEVPDIAWARKFDVGGLGDFVDKTYTICVRSVRNF